MVPREEIRVGRTLYAIKINQRRRGIEVVSAVVRKVGRSYFYVNIEGSRYQVKVNIETGEEQTQYTSCYNQWFTSEDDANDYVEFWKLKGSLPYQVGQYAQNMEQARLIKTLVELKEKNKVPELSVKGGEFTYEYSVTLSTGTDGFLIHQGIKPVIIVPIGLGISEERKETVKLEREKLAEVICVALNALRETHD